MRDFAPRALRPYGYFVHHQGRGHAERCAAVVNALPAERPVRIFCARDDIFPPLRENVTITKIPSLFESSGEEPSGAALLETPDTVHCAPVGWPNIRQAMGEMTLFFVEEAPELMIVDVSAEVAQLARLCSVPHVKVLQHGDRTDPGHLAAYTGAAGLLAPFHTDLDQPDWAAFADRIFHAPGLGVNARIPSRRSARARLGLGEAPVAVVISGKGGNGLAEAPLGVAARSFPDMKWITIGEIQRDWHATLPPNLTHHGWVENAPDYIAAADLVVSSAGNTTCAQVLTATRPWIVVPEWRYFEEQVEKARALDRAGVALHLPHLPGSAHGWRRAVETAKARFDPERQRALAGNENAARATALWLEELSARLWDTPTFIHPERNTLHA
ncbi:glycosyltransferase [Amaricoccus macauensis]|uniref:glycosyltransferase n=1 Tax=Amaricoccus macauensis TaxID=57001 RepID=UPI003C7D998E